MNYELGVSGPLKKYSLSDIRKKAEATMAAKTKGKMNIQSDIKLTNNPGPTENNFLEGLGKSENASGPKGERTSKSSLDGIEEFDKKLHRQKQEEVKHRQEMKKLLGDDYKSPGEKFEDLKRDTDWLKGL